MSRGCLLVRPCGCWLLDGRPYKSCEKHADEGGGLKPSPELDAWMERQRKDGPADAAPELDL